MQLDGRIIFCTGGCRSGKSAYALDAASAMPGSKVFIATMEARDAESLERVRRHQEERERLSGTLWQTVEITVTGSLDLPGGLAAACASGDVVLLDCLSTWVSACLEVLRVNLPGLGYVQSEEMIVEVFSAALGQLRSSGKSAVIVSSETGLGWVPADRESRLFRDALGRVNQLAAAEADEAFLLVSGLPLRLK